MNSEFFVLITGLSDTPCIFTFLKDRSSMVRSLFYDFRRCLVSKSSPRLEILVHDCSSCDAVPRT